MNVLEVHNVYKSIRKKVILDDVSFDIAEGEIFGFIGPNGAGKSTMIKTMLGLYKKDKGTILIAGINIDDRFEEALKVVGAIIENPDMYSNLTGMQNLKIFANMRKGISKNIIMEYVKLVKLENRINDKLKTYSLGMKQRLGLVQALMHNPKLLVLDEPTNGLDPIGIIELREILKKINTTYGTAVFISSHILSEVENICSKVAIIDNGKIIDIKRIEDIRREMQSRFIIEVDDALKAKEVIQEQLNIASAIQESSVIIDVDKPIIPKVNQLLLTSDINVYQIKADTKTLETEFIEKTSGSKEQIR